MFRVAMDKDPTYNVPIINIEVLMDKFPDHMDSDEVLEAATRFNHLSLIRNGVASGVTSWGLLVRVRASMSLLCNIV